jgi:hypothetical protein
MITIASTRFNQQTWNENSLYRERKMFEGCIYCAPLQLSPKIPINSLVFVLEMNNTSNKIEGIGLIKNFYQSKKHIVYDEKNYNRYVYKSNYRISRDELYRFNSTLVNAFEYILFKGKTHLKRGSGITSVPEKLLKHSSFQGIDLMNELKIIFKNHFRKDDNYLNKSDFDQFEKMNNLCEN